jgi:hypothetical protein
MFRIPIEHWRPFNVFTVALTTVQELQESLVAIQLVVLVRVDENQVFALSPPLACLPTLRRHPFIDEIHSKVGREEAKMVGSWMKDGNHMSSDPSRSQDWRLAVHNCSVQEYELPRLFMNLPYYVVSDVFPVTLLLNGRPCRTRRGMLVSWRQFLPGSPSSPLAPLRLVTLFVGVPIKCMC